MCRDYVSLCGTAAHLASGLVAHNIEGYVEILCLENRVLQSGGPYGELHRSAAVLRLHERELLVQLVQPGKSLPFGLAYELYRNLGVRLVLVGKRDVYGDGLL